MRHRVLFQSPALLLEYDMVDDFIHAQWTAQQSEDSMRAGYEQILEALQQNFCHRLLDNHLLIQENWAGLVSWFATDWYPRAQQAGLHAHTVVFSLDFFGRRSTELALEMVPGGLVAGFDSQDDARNALLHL
ncbi:hypothetical protein KBK19_10345 [Microvirga sp. STR05]|uniref:Uncharacterized protein n=1 Tax=Hymenobacter duratus TaxID=2771356 RepID=A0ABR8JJ77_9BACT|nr:hypothetical protein [Hymenobacter duratus]MBD2715435.1 hypothetical protein [Hymenobacter duratus]MBR7950343.1 hypothetical protein [Microvirga sp. STR05]